MRLCVVILALALLGTGCASVPPWERDALALKGMNLEENPVSEPAQSKYRAQVSGTSSQGGCIGCGH
jgi:hypothetical protein